MMSRQSLCRGAAFLACTLAILIVPAAAYAAQTHPSPSPIAIALFIGVIAVTLGITRWAARRTHSR